MTRRLAAKAWRQFWREAAGPIALVVQIVVVCLMIVGVVALGIVVTPLSPWWLLLVVPFGVSGTLTVLILFNGLVEVAAGLSDE